jgi:GT2 family glycosyltransferase
MDITVIIVNYNVKYFAACCIRSVLKASAGLKVEVILVDNHSSDNSIPYLTSLFPDLQIIKNERNLGFGAANNQAARLARGQYLLLLNPDTVIGEDCLKQSLHFMSRHPDAGAMGVRMVDGKGKFLRESKRAFPSPAVSLFKMTGLASLFPHSSTFSRYYLGHLSESATHQVNILAGAFMCIPKRVWDLTDGFDNDFFLYGEDIDLSWRIIGQGFHNYYYPTITILHFKGESSGKGTRKQIREFYQAMRVFTRKHFQGRYPSWFNKTMVAAIAIAERLAMAGSMITAVTRPMRTRGIKNQADSPDLLLVGTLDEAADLRKIPAGENVAERIAGIVYPGTGTQVVQGYLGNMDQLPELIRKYRIKEILLCEGMLGFAEIIALIGRGDPAVSYNIYVREISRIIGASEK